MRGYSFRDGRSCEARLLTTIPSVSEYIALLLLAEIGDIARFPDAERLASYVSLVPSVSQSGNLERCDHIAQADNELMQWG